MAAIALAAAVATLVAHLALRPIEETDLFFRLATGEQVLRQHALVHQNLFSFTHPAHPYFDSAWLFDVGAASLYRLGGFAALVLAKTGLLLGVFLGAFALARLLGAQPLVTAVVLGFAAYTVEPRMVERPHLFSFACEIALLWILHAARQRTRWLALAPGLVALWANLHAGAFLGPLVLGAAAAGALIDQGRSPAHIAPSPKALALTAVAAAASLLATPIGPAIFSYLGFHVDIHALHPVDEFRPPDLQSDLALCLFAVFAVAALLAWPRRVPTPARNLLPLLVIGALASRYVRFGADFVLLTSPVVAVRISALIRSRHPRTVPARWQGSTFAISVALLTFATIAGIRVWSPHPHQRRRSFIDLGLAPDLFPDAAIAFIEKHRLADRMYNDFELGGYLAWRWFPHHRVFVDPRLPAYPRGFHALLGRSDLPRADWDAALQGFGVETALITYAGINPRAGWWDPERWALVFRQDDARVFVRRLPHRRDLIAQHEVPATFVTTGDAGTRTEPLWTPPVSSPVSPCEWDLRLGDLLFDLDGGDDTRALEAYRRAVSAAPHCLPRDRRTGALTWLGAALLGHRRWAEAVPVIDAALAEGGPTSDPALLANRAVALEGLGRFADAAVAWDRVATVAADRETARKAALRAAALRSPPQ